jgi:phosphoglycerate dehydrogenase-like enzyme
MPPRPNDNGITRPRVLIVDPIHRAGLDLLQPVADVDVITGPPLSEGELIARVGPYHALINRSRTPIPAAVIARGEQLRIIVRAGVGLDNIDVEAARAANITVANCPNATTIAVAEHTMALMLAAARHVAQADQTMKAGLWEKKALRGAGLAGKTLGIIGFGRIGREVARRAQAFGMHVLVNQTRPTPELAQEWSVEQVDLAELLTRADVVTLHVPMRASNVGLIGARELAMLKPSAILINTARGGLVDETALLAALDRNALAAAALDVFEHEPAPNSALVSHPRVIATPHIAASTEDAQRQVAVDAARAVLDALRQKRVAETLSLRLVPVSAIRPHEGFHPRRVDRLARRLREDGLLGNPPVVAAVDGGDHADPAAHYVVLDGATRTQSFQQMGIPHIVVQVVDLERDNVQLHTWFHAVHGCSVKELLDVVRNLGGLRTAEMSMAELPHALWERSAIGYLITAEQQGFLLELAGDDGPERDWVNVLDRLVDGYGAVADVDRTLNTDIDDLRIQFPGLAGLFVYPQFSPDVVLQTATKGRLLPAGLTRFVVPGRILRVNVPLALLAGEQSLEEKRDWLDGKVETLLAQRRMRYYEEPVILLDE